MKEQINNGGQAFPTPTMAQGGNQSSENSFDFQERGSHGMTRRQYYAAEAIHGLVGLLTPEQIGPRALAYADAVIAQEDKEKEAEGKTRRDENTLTQLIIQTFMNKEADGPFMLTQKEFRAIKKAIDEYYA